MEFLLVLAVLFVVVFIVTGPLRRPEATLEAASPDEPNGPDENGHTTQARSGRGEAAGHFDRQSALSELQAAREAKYREIRDTQLDYDTGKLSEGDFQALEAGLRREALEILEQIDAITSSSIAPATSEPPEAGLRELD